MSESFQFSEPTNIEVSRDTKRDFATLAEQLAATMEFGMPYDGEDPIFAGPWPTDDGRKLSVYINNGENHTESHEVSVTETIIRQDGTTVQVEEVYKLGYNGKCSKETQIHDETAEQMAALERPNWEANPFNLNPRPEVIEAEIDRQAALFQLDMARADDEGFGIPTIDDAAIVDINNIMRDILAR